VPRQTLLTPVRPGPVVSYYLHTKCYIVSLTNEEGLLYYKQQSSFHIYTHPPVSIKFPPFIFSSCFLFVVRYLTPSNFVRGISNLLLFSFLLFSFHSISSLLSPFISKIQNFLTAVLEIVFYRIFKIFLIFSSSYSLCLYTCGHTSNPLLHRLTSVYKSCCSCIGEVFFLCLKYCDDIFSQYVKCFFRSLPSNDQNLFLWKPGSSWPNFPHYHLPKFN
jgi:hypothetical protein